MRLTNIRWKPEELIGGVTENEILGWRIRTAAVLARYQVQAMLRSSVPALLEHIHGTGFISTMYHLSLEHKTNSGDMIGKLSNHRENLPIHNFTVPLPSWLSNREDYQHACEEEIAIYEQDLFACTFSFRYA